MIELKQITRAYPFGDQSISVLRNVNITVDEGEFVTIMGSSGAGKSTLLNIIGCLDSATSGRYSLWGEPIEHYTEDQLAQLRAQRIGFVFQLFNLIPKLSALRNVELPLVYAGVEPKLRKKQAIRALHRMALLDRVEHTPAQLSGGQQQRVAIARALVNEPDLLVLDEPTGSLDSDTGRSIMEILSDINVAGTTMVMVTHDNEVARYSSRILTMQDGAIVHDQATE